MAKENFDRSKPHLNIGTIGHVDHGKTTLVDCLLRQGGVFKTHELEKVEERVMDSDDIERERGITIFSKNASARYKDYKINIVDTPGHADFGGEVQRIMKMVDSVLLLVDAFEGPMPQTKYVLKKALEQGHRPIVVVNKVDKPNARPEDVLYMVYDLFIELNANEYQLEFPVIYASGKAGFARKELTDENTDMQPLFETILEHVQDPDGDVTKPAQFLITNIAYDNYVGKLAVGRIHNGTLKRNQDVMLIKRDGKQVKGKVSVLYGYEGLKRVEIEEAEAGDIALAIGTLAEAKAAGIPVLAYGMFLNTVFEFLIIAFCIFAIISQIKRFTPAEAPVEIRKCDYCREAIADDATRCPHCTAELTIKEC